MFEEKIKEPKLSQELQNIINRSAGEKNGANIDDIFGYKYKIMNMLLSNQDILHTLHYSQFDNGEDILNGDLYKDVCVFDFMKLPDLKDKVMNYICFDISDNGSYNSLINKTITFRTVAHKDDIKTDWSISRHDLLALIIKTEFDWTNALGMHIEKDIDTGRATDDGFYYREIVYKVKTPNNIYNKINNF